MKKEQILSVLVIIGLIFVLSHLFYSFAEEAITWSAYYPAPYGYYKEIKADQMAVGSTYRNMSLADGILLVSDRIGIGTSAPDSKYRLEIPTGSGGVKAPYLEPGNVMGTSNTTLFFGNLTSNWGGFSRSLTANNRLTFFSRDTWEILLSAPTVVVYSVKLSIGNTGSSNLNVYGDKTQYNSGTAILRINTQNPAAGVSIGIGSTNEYNDNPWISTSPNNLQIHPNAEQVNSMVFNLNGGKVGIGAIPSMTGILQINGNVKFTDRGVGFAYCRTYTQGTGGAEFREYCVNNYIAISCFASADCSGYPVANAAFSCPSTPGSFVCVRKVH